MPQVEGKLKGQIGERKITQIDHFNLKYQGNLNNLGNLRYFAFSYMPLQFSF